MRFVWLKKLAVGLRRTFLNMTASFWPIFGGLGAENTTICWGNFSGSGILTRGIGNQDSANRSGWGNAGQPALRRSPLLNFERAGHRNSIRRRKFVHLESPKIAPFTSESSFFGLAEYKIATAAYVRHYRNTCISPCSFGGLDFSGM